MQPRRSKVVPDPLVYPERPTAATEGESAGPQPATSAEAAATAHAPRPRLFRVASPASPQPSAATAPASGELFSPGPNVYRRGGGPGVAASIPPKTTVLVDGHVTNTGAVVRLEQVDYSKAMRAYRVCRVEGGVAPLPTSSGELAGSGAAAGAHSSAGNPPGSATASASPFSAAAPSASLMSPTTASAAPSLFTVVNRAAAGPSGDSAEHARAPWRVVLLRLFGAADMLLLAIAVACFLVVVSRLRNLSPQSGDSTLSCLMAELTRFFARPAAVPASPDKLALETAAGIVPSSSLAALAPASYTQATHAASLDSTVTFALFFCSVLLLARRLSSAVSRVYVEEVLVMRGVGLQFSSYGIFNTLRYKIFVDLQMLRSLVIHDAFFRYQPIFYLSSSVENRAERVVYFPDTLPRLAVLRPVLNGIRGVLYGEPEEGPSLAELEERWKTAMGDVSGGGTVTEDSFAEDTATTPDEGHSTDNTDGEE